MSIAGKTQSQSYIPGSVADTHGAERDYGGPIAVATGALGAATALIGAALWSFPVMVASAILLGGWAFLTAANHKNA